MDNLTDMCVGLLHGQTRLGTLGTFLLPPTVDDLDDGVAHPVCGFQDSSPPERPPQGKHVHERTL